MVWEFLVMLNARLQDKSITLSCYHSLLNFFTALVFLFNTNFLLLKLILQENLRKRKNVRNLYNLYSYITYMFSYIFLHLHSISKDTIVK